MRCGMFKYDLPDDFMVGLSGGIDSIVLCHYLKMEGYTFTAIHVDHGINEKSNEWSDFCRDFCEEHRISFISRKVTLQGNNLENAARNARYKEIANHTKLLITAHHMNDQYETFFLKLFRGSGISGLCAMEYISRNFGMTIYRPLLNVPKSEIIEYAKTHNLKYVNDPSNQDTDYDRNFLRAMMPSLMARFNNFSGLNKAISNIRDAELLISDLYEIDRGNVCISEEEIDLRKLSKLPSHRIKNFLYMFVRSKGGIISCGSLENSVKMIMNYRADKSMKIDIGVGVLHQCKHILTFTG